jgi:RNA polymerase sigma-32 factor
MRVEYVTMSEFRENNMSINALQTFTYKDLSVKDLTAYISWAHHIPMLTREEELFYSNRLYHHQDLDAAKKLILAHLRFVIRVAKGYTGYGLPLSDLIQEGNVGLMKAVKRFNPAVGVRLVSFAVHWVRAEIHEFILKNWRIVKIATTKAQRKLFFNLRKASKRIGWLSNDEVDAIAEELDVHPKEVRHMEARLNQYDQSLDQPFEYHDASGVQNSAAAPIHLLEDQRFDPAYLMETQDICEKRLAALTEALGLLDERSRRIIRSRWLSHSRTTLTELAKQYSVSAERIRQIEHQAMKKMLAHMKEKVKE